MNPLTRFLITIRNLLDKAIAKLDKPQPFISLPFPELPYDGTPNGGGWHLSNPGFSATTTYPHTYKE